MWVYKIVARREPSYQIEPRSQMEAFDNLLGAFRLDGHVLGRDIITVSLDWQIEAYVIAPGHDAFEAGFQNEWISKSVERLKAVGSSQPSFIQLGEDPSEPDACMCTDPSAFILFTSYIQLQSPICCDDCFMPYPLYRLPRFNNGEFVEVVSWADDYKACDTLYMNSVTGERFGYEEMSEFDSSLSQRGRAICRHFEEHTGQGILLSYLQIFRSRRLHSRSERMSGMWR